MKFVPILFLCLMIASCSRSALEYISRGEAELKAGKAAAAVLSFRKALQKDPDSAQAYLGLGRAYYEANDIAGAYQALSRAVELMPDNQKAITKLAEVAMGALLVDLRRPEHLKAQLQTLTDRILKQNPQSTEGLKFKGLLAAVEQKHEDALDYFRRANSTSALNPGLKLLEIEALMNTGRKSEGESAARSLIQNKPGYGPAYDLMLMHLFAQQRIKEAEELLLQKVRANPDNVAFQLQLARFYSRLGKEDAVQSAVDTVLAKQPAEDAFVRVGDFYVEIGELDRALPLYRQGLNGSDSVKLKCLVKIAEVLGMQKKYPEALTAVRDGRKISMHDEQAVRLEADLLTQTGTPESLDLATRIYRELLIRKPGDPFVRYNLSRALAAKGDADAAREELEQCIRITPTHLAAINALAYIYRASGEPRDLLILADKVLAEDSNNIGAQLLRAEGLLRTGQPAQARTVLLPLQKHPSIGREAGLLLARVQLAEKHFERAEQEFRRHHVPGQLDLRALEGLSDVLLLQGKIPAVNALWQQEASRSPDSLPVKRGLAKAMYLSQKYDAAVALYRQISVADPKNVETQVYLAASLLGGGSHEEGMEVLRRASELPSANRDLIEETIGYLYQFDGNGVLAEVYHRKVLDRNPSSAPALNNLAYSLATRGEKLDEALALATKATQLQPDNPEFSDTMAFILLQGGRNVEAQERFQGLVQRFPNHAGFRYHHALALMQAGRHDVAKKELTFALPHAKSSDLIDKIRAALTTASKR